MKKRTIWIITFIFILIFVLFFSWQSKTKLDLVTLPVKRLQQYQQNKDKLTNAELKEVFTLFTPPKTEKEKQAYNFYYAPSEKYIRLWRAVSAGALEVLKSYKIVDTEIDGAKATVKVYRKILSRSQSDEPDKTWTQTITITLKKQGNKWLIDKCGKTKYACFLGIE